MTGQFNTEKKQNAWITHLKQWSVDQGVPYASAISDPKCKEAYNNSKGSSGDTNVSKKPKAKKEKNVVEPEVVLEVEPEAVLEVEKKKKKKNKKKKNKEVPVLVEE